MLIGVIGRRARLATPSYSLTRSLSSLASSKIFHSPYKPIETPKASLFPFLREKGNWSEVADKVAVRCSTNSFAPITYKELDGRIIAAATSSARWASSKATCSTSTSTIANSTLYPSSRRRSAARRQPQTQWPSPRSSRRSKSLGRQICRLEQILSDCDKGRKGEQLKVSVYGWRTMVALPTRCPIQIYQ